MGPDPNDRRLWWQKLADDIGEALAGLLRLIGALWQAWNWRSRGRWKDDI